MSCLESSLRDVRASGRRCVVPYLMAGSRPDWLDLCREMGERGAAAIEIGVPFSDPSIDGPVIQQAGERALAAGVTPDVVWEALGTLEVAVPIVVMTYVNLIFRGGFARVAAKLTECGVAGTILADLPWEEGADWRKASLEHGLDCVQLVAPSTPLDRAQMLAKASQGFVYCVGTMGVTGERATLAVSARENAKRVVSATETPVLVGIGVSNADQARSLDDVCHGVVVGSALMRRVLEGEPRKELGDFIAELCEIS